MGTLNTLASGPPRRSAIGALTEIELIINETPGQKNSQRPRSNGHEPSPTPQANKSAYRTPLRPCRHAGQEASGNEASAVGGIVHPSERAPPPKCWSSMDRSSENEGTTDRHSTPRMIRSTGRPCHPHIYQNERPGTVASCDRRRCLSPSRLKHAHRSQRPMGEHLRDDVDCQGPSFDRHWSNRAPRRICPPWRLSERFPDAGQWRVPRAQSQYTMERASGPQPLCSIRLGTSGIHAGSRPTDSTVAC
jgi:hypothetical protein